MNGFEDLIFSMYNKFNPDIKITLSEGKVFEEKDYLRRLKEIRGISNVMPVMEDNAAIRNGDYQTVCTVKGVAPDYFKVNDLKGRITEGEADLTIGSINYLVLGAGIDMKLNASIDGPFSTLSLITPRRGDYNASDVDAIHEMQIQPGGVITMDDIINNRYVFVPIDFARELFEREGMLSAIEIKLDQNANPGVVMSKVRKLMGSSFRIQDRMEQQASLYKMFKSEKWASYAILTFILLIAAFNALGSLTMLVIEKKDDIRTLAGMGASKGMIRRIFFTNGFLISGMGAIAGLVIGIFLVWLQERYGLVTMQGAIIESYPVKLVYADIVLVAATALGLGLLTGIYPAAKSVKALR